MLIIRHMRLCLFKEGNMKKEKKRLLIDLDGVLNTYTGEYIANYIPPIAEGAREFLEELNNEFELILFSAREQEFVKQWSIEYDVNKYFTEITNKKRSAYLIIDDRCICFKGNFNDTLKQIKNFKKHTA